MSDAPNHNFKKKARARSLVREAGRMLRTAKAKYDHIDFKPPASVADAAEKGLKYRRKQKGDKAGLSTEEAASQGIGSGVQRAVNLKNRDTLSPETVRRMHNFFNRHEKNKSIDPEHRGEPWKDNGYVSWLLWGGDPGRSWAAKVVKQMEAADKEAKSDKKTAGAPDPGTCMESGCDRAPEIECVWADGRGRAWFCRRHFDSWSERDTDGGMPKDIVKKRRVPDGVVGERYGESPKSKKKASLEGMLRLAKATGTKCGDGESVGLFIPLPKDLAKKFPSLGDEDTSPSHVTFLYIGDFKGCTEQERLVDALRESCRRWWPMCRAVLGELDYFDHPDKDRRVPHVTVDFDKDLSGFKHRVKQELHEAGFDVKDKFPEYRPHVTLAYLPGMDGEWDGEVPQGSWEFDEMEVWGLPEVHTLRLGPSVHKVSSDWMRRNAHRRVAARHLVRKIAGWWAIRRDNPGINPPPVDKGGLMNAIPGEDPDDARYNGDGPADIMDGAIRGIDLEYLMAWGRPVTKMELEAVFDFCTGPLRADGSRDYESGPEPINRWFLEMARWLGKEPEEVRFFQGDTDVLRTMRALWREGGPEHLEPYRRQILRAIEDNARFEGECATRDLEKALEARLQVIRDEQFRGGDTVTGPMPKVVIETEPGEAGT